MKLDMRMAIANRLVMEHFELPEFWVLNDPWRSRRGGDIFPRQIVMYLASLSGVEKAAIAGVFDCSGLTVQCSFDAVVREMETDGHVNAFVGILTSRFFQEVGRQSVRWIPVMKGGSHAR